MPPVHERAYEVVGGVGGTEEGAEPEVAPPVLKPLPVQEVAHEEPPETLQVREVFCPCWTVVGLAESEPVQELTVIPEPLLHEAEEVCPDTVSVTATVACFVPAVVYAFWTEAVVPERPSVPLHEYVKEPEPPETDEFHVTG